LSAEEARPRIVLVHGAWHGAWCWDRVAGPLRDLGYDVVVPDLPGHGTRADERIESLRDYVGAVVDVIIPGTVLVGHSMGGLVVTAVADAVPELLSHVVYVAAFVPRDGEDLFTSYGEPPDFGELGLEATDDGMIIISTLEAARRLFYADCSPEDQQWAFEQLTPQPLLALLEPVALPNFDKAAVPRSYVLCRQDGIVPPDIQRKFADRLGVAPIELDTSHSPFLSSPAAVVEVIERAATPA
jgi:pimeloyl-ACP methyl ester carboxylesterase